ncbi:alpha/beta hydrolase fold family protein [Pseudarthrobacter siccitolerans]|uniref:Alpha/beta hydrolase fold family protein n=1 Tax=Pseudarthrobacter siccitolerans TaxID=861266 RepID=A0A024H026_9MICC|nr:alpha/beta hydrolase [Pseudarthrobacter siccitolerans]CCQ45109.1 alpha/beta hydrolase fold family protein [Pseudarthrobacter siccitolerans]
MDVRIGGVSVHCAEYGAGMPVLALHGAGVDHREVAGALEPVFSEIPNYRRLYPDLPGMGLTPAPGTITSNDDVLDLLLGLIDHVIGDEPFLLLGHSYGGYLARALAALRPHQAVGLTLICPVGAHTQDVPAHEVLVSQAGLPGGLDPDLEATYRDYFVVQTPETLRSFKDRVAPSAKLVDEAALTRVFARWELRDRPEAAHTYPHPVLILAGRQDATAGYAGQLELAKHYRRATVAVLDRAGHALFHEQPKLVQAHIAEWLQRVRGR